MTATSSLDSQPKRLTETSSVRRRRRLRRGLRWLPRYLILLVLLILFITPFYVLVRNAGMRQSEILAPAWHLLPKEPRWADNMGALLSDPVSPIGSSLRLSVVVALITVVGAVTLASLAGYGLARLPSRWSRAVLYLVVLTLIIPSATSFLPLYVIVANLGWVNSIQGLTIPVMFSAFNVFLFRQFFLEFPREIEEAGTIDGLGPWGIYRHLVLPNSIGIFVSLGTLTFLASWNSFLWPLVIGTSSSMWTIQVALSTFITAQVINLPLLFAGALLAIIPVLIVFVVLQRYLVEGFKRSGISGS